MCQPGFHVFCYGSPDSTIKPDPSLRCDCGVYRWGQAPDLSRESSRGQIDRLTRANATLQQQLMDEKTLSSDQHENLLATRGKVERLTAEVERQCQANRTLKSELTAARNQLFKDNIERMPKTAPPSDLCGLCGLPGADKIPHPIYWPGECKPDQPLVHADCERDECRRASNALAPQERNGFLDAIIRDGAPALIVRVSSPEVATSVNP